MKMLTIPISTFVFKMINSRIVSDNLGTVDQINYNKDLEWWSDQKKISQTSKIPDK